MKRKFIRIAIAATALSALYGVAIVAIRRLVPSHGDADSDELALAVVMNGIELHSRAMSFRGGSARAIMGGVKLDLRDAQLDPAGASLRLRTVMGGIELIVPAHWRLSVARSSAVMGGVAYPPAADGQPDGAELQLDCRAVFGGIEVKPAATEE